jgi:hypothetical protein
VSHCNDEYLVRSLAENDHVRVTPQWAPTTRVDVGTEATGVRLNGRQSSFDLKKESTRSCGTAVEIPLVRLARLFDGI